MPRNGSGVLSAPAGTLGTPNTVIESAKYNAFVNDWVADGNAARPITAGGTAGVTAVAGADNLSTKGTDIPSATTTDIGAATGRYVHITGTTTITGLGTKTAGVLRIVTFDGALTLTHNATSLILPSGASIITAAGDVATFISEGGGNWRCVGYSRASGGQLAGKAYVPKAANYTGLDADYDKVFRFSAAATYSIDVTANLRTNWYTEVWADGGAVTIDPNSTDTINGAATLVVQQGQKALIFKTAATTFQANVYGDPLSGPQIQSYASGLALTTNVADATNDVDIAVGVAASDVSPYNLMQLTSALTKRLDANWVVGTNQGGLDTGAVGNNTYYIWLIQRSDTGVTDVLFSLSSTAPTMPTNYDRKRRIGVVVRAAAANGPPYLDMSTGGVKPDAVVTLSGTSQDITGIPAGVRRLTIILDEVTVSAAAQLFIQLGTSAGVVTSGYLATAGATSSGGGQGSTATTFVPISYSLTAMVGPHRGHIFLTRVGGTGRWQITLIAQGASTGILNYAAAGITLPGTLDRIRFGTAAGTATLGGNVEFLREMDT